MDLASNPCNEILYIAFNQDQSCFVCGTENGFRVYNTDPFRLTFRREFEGGGGLCIVAMLFRCNILALVGGGTNPRFQPHKVMIWDDKTPRCIAELSFRSQVRQVKLRRDIVLVLIDRKVYIYRFSDLTLIDHIETFPNPRGLCTLSASQDRTVLACPGVQKGKILVVFYDQQKIQSAQSGLANTNQDQKDGGDFTRMQNCREKTTLITAHESKVSQLSLNFEGTLVASASDKGTLIRIFDAESGGLLQELRRGVDRADIQCITFSQNSQWVVVSSDKGTIHVFAVGSDAQIQAAQNRRSNFSFLGLSYFASEWSHAQFRVQDYRSLVCFGQDPNTVIVACANGSYFKCRFDPVNGGEMQREDYKTFSATEDD
mmetsp:Transcript_10372/g.25463  ORF Transcript_10372/g.25463 Transcript_10372/m.25463 type:complete len:373 (-) Transcript_10372:291-1409(-)